MKSPDPSIGDLIRRYVREAHSIRPLGVSHQYALEKLLDMPIAKVPARKLSAQHLIEHARARRTSVGPSTAQQDITYLRGPLGMAAAAWGLPVSLAPFADAKPLLARLQLTGKSRPRERRPSADEFTRLIEYFREQDQRSDIPMATLMEFAVWSARRLGEITRLLWEDVNAKDRTCIVRDMKDPRSKRGNDHTFPLLGRAWDIVQAQPRSSTRIFPYNTRSASARYTRAKAELGITNLRFHDLRREAASRLFERGYSVPEVALVTGHKNPATLLRVYTKLRPADLHEGPAASRSSRSC